ncbi:MAG: hypothetical protein O9325_01700, partial [Roseomonas sp.]|nr:hypothetical protein [Roseomonas sp.]
VQGHFRRTAGGAHQRELDSFITQMANAQSQDQIRSGSQYCPLITPLFGLAMAQPNVEALAALSQERNVLNPLTTPDCSAAPAATTAATTAATPGRPATPPRQNQASR